MNDSDEDGRNMTEDYPLTDESERLPFALDDDDDDNIIASAQKLTFTDPTLFRKSLHSGDVLSQSLCSNSCSSSLPPRLAASLVSTDAGYSTNSCSNSAALADSSTTMNTTSLSHVSSQYLDTAASLFSANSIPTLDASTSGTTLPMGDSGSGFIPTNNNSVSIAFSQFMLEADSKRENSNNTRGNNNHTQHQRRRLPVLTEEEYSVADNSDRSTVYRNNLSPVKYNSPFSKLQQNTNSDNNTFSNDPLAQSLGNSFAPERTILPAVADSIHFSSSQQQQRRLATLAGATVKLRGDCVFDVSIDMASSCSTRDIMDVISNPERLSQWYDAVNSLVVLSVVNSDDNSLPNNNVAGTGNNDREYGGEWIQATCTNLIPPNNTNCVYNLSHRASELMGFPQYGKINMFIERQKEQVGLSVGPFPGRVQVVHKIQVEKVMGQRLRITDRVKVQRIVNNNNNGETNCSCGFFDILERCMLPTVDDYMDQILSSMARLRFLVENGYSSFHDAVVEEQDLEENSALSKPLLAV